MKCRLKVLYFKNDPELLSSYINQVPLHFALCHKLVIRIIGEPLRSYLITIIEDLDDDGIRLRLQRDPRCGHFIHRLTFDGEHLLPVMAL